MSAKLIDGKAIALAIREEIRADVQALTSSGARPPGLGVVLVGSHMASQSYVKSKTAACHDAGFHSRQVDLPESVSADELLRVVRELNDDNAIDGILVQLPLPAHIDENLVIDAIDPAKDVDGFHPMNAGLLAVGRPAFVPCTPLGVKELLVRSGVETAGRLAVVLGRSNIVGKPMAQLLAQKGLGGDATVCVVHSRSKQMTEMLGQADIVIAAIGKARFVKGEHLKPGAVVIDVGINRIEDASAPKGSRLVGDVDFESARAVASAITPVPGGVGPMTIAMLLRNTLEARKRRG